MRYDGTWCLTNGGFLLVSRIPNEVTYFAGHTRSKFFWSRAYGGSFIVLVSGARKTADRIVRAACVPFVCVIADDERQYPTNGLRQSLCHSGIVNGRDSCAPQTGKCELLQRVGAFVAGKYLGHSREIPALRILRPSEPECTMTCLLCRTCDLSRAL